MSAPAATKSLRSAPAPPRSRARRAHRCARAAGCLPRGTPRPRRGNAGSRRIALDHQLRALMAERTRPGLVLDQHRGGAAPRIGADRLLHGDRVAVAGVAIGQPQHVRRGGDDGLDRVAPSPGTSAGPCRASPAASRRSTRAGDKADPEPGLLDQTRAHRIAAAGHHLHAGSFNNACIAAACGCICVSSGWRRHVIARNKADAGLSDR